MIIFKPYSNIKDFLQRFTLLKVGKLHIRLHKIVDEDQTPLYHNHPFHYISIILKGGYTESILNGESKIVKSHGLLSIINRDRNVFHRIDKLRGETITLFIAWGNYGWKAHSSNPDRSEDGLFERMINGKRIWCKKEDGVWFIGNADKDVAQKETRHSIHQIPKKLSNSFL